MVSKPQENVKTLSVFDFDGTLTRHDSFIPFLRFAFGRRRFTRKMLHLVLPTIRCLRHKLTRDELKEILINTFMKNVDEEWVKEKAIAYCQKYFTKLMRPKGLLAVAAEIHSGAIVTLCSASPEIVLQPFAEQLGIGLIGTQLEVIEGKLTGKISGNNCRCAQKVARLEQVYGPLEHYHLRAWGDTRGDYELLSAAQDPHWRHFHSSAAPRKSPIDQLKR
ncbi:HAD family hydrolase [Rosenbergiella australiborealis]|uniref:HAD family hydrolase n=1 Tax=Rosenbergiella australiborealis TaxID=1544696 RepID=A0ABS5TC21_9GAMM|nr:HAD family hydrolase [Rosenbergiella australiborealis]MBT0728473.1 HAD family hydrolase [Rosenbergiella australiborealis]